jgi:hypothetical protein
VILPWRVTLVYDLVDGLFSVISSFPVQESFAHLIEVNKAVVDYLVGREELE